MSMKFVGSFDTVKSLPKSRAVEFAFIGRSNVGKSSLVNAIAGAAVARTSKTPGRTQSLNLFLMDDAVSIMDLPGYGYAKTSKENSLCWLERLEEYLLNRAQLKILFILVDARHEVKKSDLEIMDFCDANAVLYQVVLTKCDKSNKTEIEKIKCEICAGPRPAMAAEILVTSAEKKIGIEDLRKAIK